MYLSRLHSSLSLLLVYGWVHLILYLTPVLILMWSAHCVLMCVVSLRETFRLPGWLGLLSLSLPCNQVGCFVLWSLSPCCAGEGLAAIPLIKLQQRPDCNILMTTTTTSALWVFLSKGRVCGLLTISPRTHFMYRVHYSWFLQWSHQGPASGHLPGMLPWNLLWHSRTSFWLWYFVQSESVQVTIFSYVDLFFSCWFGSDDSFVTATSWWGWKIFCSLPHWMFLLLWMNFLDIGAQPKCPDGKRTMAKLNCFCIQ